MAMHTAAELHTLPTTPGRDCILSDLTGTRPAIGANAAWRKLILQAEIVAPHLQIAAIEGEQGAGKQTLAHYLHSRSPLNRSAFQRHDAREWLVNEADPSTLAGFLYLDRVDLLASPGQGLLLGVLKTIQDHAFGRTVLIASSETSLRYLAGQGQFMPDLAFRLTAVRFSVPPLRERKEDVAALSQALLDRICTRYQQRPAALGPGVLARLLQHSWPGNIRELASVLEAALLEASNGMIRPEDLVIPSYTVMRTEPQSTPRAESLGLDAVIHHHVQYVLDLNRGNKLRAARQLGISRSTLYRILGNESLLAR